MECNDPTSNPASTNDWTCACTSPTVGDIATGGDATCILDECTITSCGAEWQACNDPNTFPGVEDDWTCSCISPTVGEPATAAATTCTLNECNSTGCGGDWMSCSDPTSNPASTNDWTCTCLSPSIGDTATGKDAACTLDECETIGCGGDWMFCRDPNKDAGSTGDWTCTCLSPTVGKTATGGDATCILNECNANKECAEDWMHCADPNTSPDSEDDWTCSCISPALGKTVTAAVASCSWDECADPGCVADQVCDDPDQDAFSRGDYTCACTLPAVGPIGTGTDAQCTFDECGSSGCADGQVCDDPDTNQLSSGDWTCTCIAPTVGDAIGRAAVCTLDECKPSGCDDGQSCFDPDQDPDSKDDWTCTCVSPAVGNVTIGEPTACTLDECATSVCGKGQECTDPTRDPFATDDWTCTCPSPSIGSATAATANCTLDECTTAGAICKVAGQVCHDPDHNADVAGDWTCNCTSPRVGEATAAAAVCQLEECQTKLTVGLSDEKTQVIELFDYEPNELVCWTISCEVAGAIGSFEFGALNTEPKDDLVVVNGEPFSGSTVPEGVVATFTGGAAAEVLFRGDSDAIGGTDDEDSGFSVNVTCKLPPTLAPATVAPPTRAPPTAAPKTSAPTMAPTLAPSTGSPPTSAPEEEIELAMSFEVELQTGNVFDAGTRMRQQIEVSMNSSLTFRGACRRVNGSAGEECFTADELQAVAERRSAAALQSTPTWRFLFGLLLRSVTGVTAGAFEAAGETVTQTVLPGGKFLGAVAATPVPRVVITGDRAEDDDDSRSLFAGLLVGGVVLLVLLLSGAAFLLSRKPPAQHTEHAPHHKNEPIDS
ncbi:hypothetical protein DIPPA_16245 [Diplonema papillatum]|nr:hypothetical protein DIPPA_16245 [Diplonema papillatum]